MVRVIPDAHLQPREPCSLLQDATHRLHPSCHHPPPQVILPSHLTDVQSGFAYLEPLRATPERLLSGPGLHTTDLLSSYGLSGVALEVRADCLASEGSGQSMAWHGLHAAASMLVAGVVALDVGVGWCFCVCLAEYGPLPEHGMAWHCLHAACCCCCCCWS